MTRDETELNVLQPVLGNLERTLIDEFLRLHGLDRQALDALPENKRHDLLAEASTYASARLTEIESRSHYIHELHSVEGAGVALGQAAARPATPVAATPVAAAPAPATPVAAASPSRESEEEEHHGPWMTS